MIHNKEWLTNQILEVTDNNIMSNYLYNLLYLISINRFVWYNLPNNIDCDFIERELNNEGELAFINHPTWGYVVTFCIGQNINLYGRYTDYYCFSADGVINDYFKADEIVIIRNNKLSESTKPFLQRYANYLGEIKKIKEVNLNAQKTPIILEVEEAQLLSTKNVYAQYEGNSPVILTRKTLDEKGFNVLKTDAPYLLDKLQEEFISALNEHLTFQGINTTPFKKERMVTDEVNANNDMVNICLSMFLNPRKQALKEINEKFGLDIKLELSEYCKEDLKPKEMEVNKNE